MTNRTAEATLLQLEKIVNAGVCFPADVLKIRALVLNATAQLRNEDPMPDNLKPVIKCEVKKELRECVN